MFDFTEGLNSDGWWSHTHAPLGPLMFSEGLIHVIEVYRCYCSLMLIENDDLTGKLRCHELDLVRDNVDSSNDWPSKLHLQLLLGDGVDYGTKRRLHAIARFICLAHG